MKLGFYLEKLSIGLLGLLFLAFPLVTTSLTTEVFVLPKQFLLAATVLLVTLALAIKMLIDKEVRLRRTPLDLPLLVFILVVFLSSLFAVNKAESLIVFVPFFFAAVTYFLIVNTARTKNSALLLIGSFILGASILSLNSILSFYKIYLLPFDFSRFQTFTPLGSLLDQAIYLGVAIILSGYFIFVLGKEQRGKLNLKSLGSLSPLGLAFVVTVAGFAATVFSLVKIQNPFILPIAYGFQIAFAAISQDTQRLIQAFLFGSGFGTFASDFTRFKQAAFNQNELLWNLTFFRSSSFVLELIATTGIAGLVSYLFLVYRTLKQSPLFIPAALFFLISFVLPFSFTTQALLFLLLGIFGAWQGLSSSKFFDVEIALVALKRGLIAVSTEGGRVNHRSILLPFIFFLVALLFVAALAFFTTKYAQANLIFQRSLIAASQNKGSEAYQGQSQALDLVNYNDGYQRVFSQTNLALANSLSQSVPQGSSPSAQTQQTIYTLIQQSINSARLATSLSPQTSLNWQNLSSIYRSLIGFGRNADQFAILASQQAVALDSTNPAAYVNLGGLYYQLRLFDKAQEQFRIAINLKPNFANAYYNLGYAFKEKGDLKTALEQLNIVKDLVRGDKANLKKITDEIKALEAGLKRQEAGPQQPETLPPQTPPVAIPPPLPTPTPTPTPTATQSAQ